MMLETARLRLQRQVRELRRERLAAKRLVAETRDLLRQSQAQALRPAEPFPAEPAAQDPEP